MTDPLLTIDQLATVLGSSRKAIYHRRSRGQLPPGVKIGRRVLYRPADVEAFIEANLEADRDKLRRVGDEGNGLPTKKPAPQRSEIRSTATQDGISRG